MNIETVFQETKNVWEGLIRTSLLNSYDTFQEKHVALGSVTDEFFFVSEVLKEDPETSDQQRYSFEHRIMSHAINIAIHKAGTLSIDELNKEEILARFVKDWEAS